MSFRQSIVTPPLVHSLAHVPRTWSRMRFYPEQKNVRLRATSDEEDDLIRSRYLPEEPSWLRRMKWFPAKGMRVALKLARGAYWLSVRLLVHQEFVLEVSATMVWVG